MRYIIIITLSFFLLQCFSSSRSRTPRGKLGDAMEKASDDHKGERKVKTDEREAEHYYVEEEDDQETTVMTVQRMQFDSTKVDSPLFGKYQGLEPGRQSVQSDSTKVASLEEQRKGWSIIFKYEFGLNGRDYFLRMNQTELGVGGFSGRVAGYLYVGYGWNVTNDKTFIGKAVESPVSEYLLGFELHYYTTPEWTFIGHHVFGGFNGGLMTWTYKNPIEIEDTGEIIKGDNIERYHLYAGTGINIIQTKYFNLGGYATAGVRLYKDITGEGFENDQFKTEGFVKLGLRLEIGLIR